MTYGIFWAYGLFWQRDEVDWYPGTGNRGQFRLLGRIGARLPNLRVADFRMQQGIYILYGNAGPHYAGLTRSQTLGKRLRDHLSDDHANHWDRFSWFSFRRVLKAVDEKGLQKFGASATARTSSPNVVMGDVEALLIRAMALRNIAKMNFAHAEKWTQVKLPEVAKYLAKADRA